MDEPLSYFKILISLLALANPIGAIPIYSSLTGTYTREHKKVVVRQCSIGVFIIMASTLILGSGLLRLFNVSVAAFQVGGGILMLLMSIAMVQGKNPKQKHTNEEHLEASKRENISIVPLATPILAGPGTISTIILYSQELVSWQDRAILMAFIFAVSLSVYWLLRSADFLTRMVSQTGINIMTRLMGMLLITLSVEFLVKGLSVLFPALQ